jgi:hypothetical protein
MKKSVAILCLTACGLMLLQPAFAGGPKETHPCYGVADCKTKGSKQEFSACIKAHKAEADANAACAEFRKDKQAYLQSKGIADLKELFN